MRYTKYKLVPWDIAVFFIKSDLTQSRQRKILTDLFCNHNDDIVYPIRNDFLKFKNKVSELKIILGTDSDVLNEAELLMNEAIAINPNSKEYEYDCFGSYFKYIKLQLMYVCHFKEIKLKTLLSDLGFKRKTAKRMYKISLAIQALGLAVYIDIWLSHIYSGIIS